MKLVTLRTLTYHMFTVCSKSCNPIIAIDGVPTPVAMAYSTTWDTPYLIVDASSKWLETHTMSSVVDHCNNLPLPFATASSYTFFMNNVSSKSS